MQESQSHCVLNGVTLHSPCYAGLVLVIRQVSIARPARGCEVRAPHLSQASSITTEKKNPANRSSPGVCHRISVQLLSRQRGRVLINRYVRQLAGDVRIAPESCLYGTMDRAGCTKSRFASKSCRCRKRCHRHQSDTCHKASYKRSRSSHFANSLSCVHEFEQRGLNAVPWR